MRRVSIGWRMGVIPSIMLLASCSQEPPKELCESLNSTINNNLLEIAVSNSVGETSDSSAVQQSARAQVNQNRLSVIMINVQLQTQNKCSPRSTPIEPLAYGKNSSACYIARSQRNIAGYSRDQEKISAAEKKVAETCDFSKWTPDSAK